MMLRRLPLFALALPLLAISLSAAEEPSEPSSSATPMTENPLLKESTLDFHYPPFDKIRDQDYAPAFEQGMAEQIKEIEPIANNPDSPTF
jgi:peptidyl-dipeptidase Dcp